jgi:hypothetical protein
MQPPPNFQELSMAARESVAHWLDTYHLWTKPCPACAATDSKEVGPLCFTQTEDAANRWLKTIPVECRQCGLVIYTLEAERVVAHAARNLQG